MDNDFVRDALLTANYFPNHKVKSREMPPCFHTKRLSAAVANLILNAGPPYQSKYWGSDYSQYTLTRFNGGPRVCGVPHPFAYCKLVQRIHQDWNKIEPQIESQSSAIQARQHPDGRLFVMDYGNHSAKSKRYLEKQSCSRFVASADISNFYPSLYTHAIPWAIIGIDAAKQQTNGNLWFNVLDKLVRECRRAETNGVSVGPGTSSLIAEVVLCQVDRKLQKLFSYDRFIDDYTCYARTRQEAEEFLRSLETELAKYNLFLNFRKTSIVSLPNSEVPQWIDELAPDALGSTPSFYQTKIFLSRALHLTDRFPDGSVLRYAINSLIGRNFDDITGEYLLRRLFGFALGHPHVAASLEPFIKFGYDAGGRFKYAAELLAVVESSALSRRSDAICWSLWIARVTNVAVPTEIEQKILKTFDTFGLVSLYQVGSSQTRRSITRFVKKRILSRPQSVIERNWFLVHYLLNTGRLKSNEVVDRSLRVLKAQKVDLFD